MEINPPDQETELGMEVYKSQTPGIGGTLKQLPEDFIVEEITPEGTVLELDKDAVSGDKTWDVNRRSLHVTMQKYNWDTMRALKEISRELHVSNKRIGFAGTKDKRALTTQRISIWDKKIEDLEGLRIKDIILRDYEYSDDTLGLGCLYGNRFTLVLRNLDLDADSAKDRVATIIKELHGQAPAFYGIQRFGGVRPITHLVGREILRGDFKAAVMTYLAKDYEAEEPNVRNMRKALAETGDYRSALRDFPANLTYESALLNHLVNNQEDYRGAIRKLPENLAKMFIHAYQGYIFNKALSEYIRRKIPVDRLPLAGYRIQLDEITMELLQKEGVALEDFKVKGMSDLSSKGEYRDCYIPVEGLELTDAGPDELNPGKNKVTIRFSLKKGSYATVLLREIMKN
ncbi:MAG: tRNA pseudouridine(13) synthase TruD [Candidatus Altiarchaeia archaeon]